MQTRLLIVFSLLLGLNLFSQDSVLLELRTSNNLHRAIWQKPDTSVIFTSLNFSNNHTDTLGKIRAFPYNWLNCAGNDTSVTFCQHGWHVAGYRYELKDQKWQNNSFYLPPTFPIVGMLWPDQKYDKYTYSFFEDGHVEAIKEIIVVDDTNSPSYVLEKYKVRFDLDRRTKGFFSTLVEKIIE